MTATLISLAFFLALVSGLGFLYAVAIQRRVATGDAPEVRRPRLLHARKRAARESSGTIGRFDRWLLGLVHESGLGWDATATVLFAILCGLVIAGALFLWHEAWLPAALGLVAGTALPITYLAVCRRRRIHRLQEQLAPALEMLARSVRAGQSLDQALLMVGNQSAEPLAGEFRQSARHLELGLSMAATMRSLVDRVRLQDMRIFTTTLAVHRQTGGNIARVLERLASVVRDRLSYRRQLRAATAAARASAVLIATIGPAVFLFFYLFRPEYVSEMLASPAGQSLLITAAFLEFAGLIWTVRLLKPAY